MTGSFNGNFNGCLSVRVVCGVWCVCGLVWMCGRNGCRRGHMCVCTIGVMCNNLWGIRGDGGGCRRGYMCVCGGV